MGLTQEVAHYVAKTRYRDIPSEVIRAARGFVLDGLGVALAGVTEEGSRIVLNHVRQMGGKEESTVLGTGLKVPAPKAALINGVSGHAMDYDDTQLSTSRAGGLRPIDSPDDAGAPRGFADGRERENQR